MTEIIKPKQKFYCLKNKTHFESGEYEIKESEKNKKKYMFSSCPNGCKGSHTRLCKKEKEKINEVSSDSIDSSNSKNSKKSIDDIVTFEKKEKKNEKVKEVKIKKEKKEKSDNDKKNKKISKRKLAMVNDENIITA